jgi:hypothetical protein
MNERCDELATQAADGKNLKTDFVYEELFKAEKMNTINKNPSI